MILKDLNDSIDYIDKNLTNDLSLFDIANFVGLPEQHYRNIFIFLTGVGLSEYIKKENYILLTKTY